jgi:hypothetical protein
MKAALPFAILGGLVAAQPAFAKPDRVTDILTTAQMCSADASSVQSIAALRAAGWRDVTPVMFGKSMAEVTGGTMLRRGEDTALVNAAGGAAGQNCQFDFAKASTVLVSQVEAAFTQAYGSPTASETAMQTWSREGSSYSLVTRLAGKLTVLWLPQQTQKAAN